ncbi:DUF1800 domain-containing protein [Abyssalbus ytuae]|uniref:DUF1800 domain-containing protein n=1 Tax=Abyssalbus ytuae TaxID=2926907 RepID=A0A9E6ZQN1_9FLAO|nr:DUF1800 domain-containing protein [Abyssalbus ytuae]UOB16123.1 DUF1800 domain-containing protein [Abyssalbus ytuae]
MEFVPTCNFATLDVFVPTTQKPWDEKRAKHAYRRLAFGANNAQITAALSQTPENFIDSLIDEAINLSPTPAPEWGYWSVQDYVDNDLVYNDELRRNQTSQMTFQFATDILNEGLRARLVKFWSNHFVTEISGYDCPSYQFQYYNMLQRHALGNFKEFVREVGINPAILIYLNGFDSTNNEPNENYSRELFELFTLGENNGYTQSDIVETSKALTGYNVRTAECGEITFDETTFDDGPKTIFGQTGNWGYDDVIEILFTERGNLISRFICEKLYKYFVSPNVNDDIITQLAADFEQDFEIAPMLRRLLKSEHFFDDNAIGVIMKSPYDLTIGFLTDTGFSYDDNQLRSFMNINDDLGQRLFNPIDVAGWQGNHEWVKTDTMVGRWRAFMPFFNFIWEFHREELRSLAIELSGNSNDVYYVARVIVDWFISNGLETEDAYGVAVDTFKLEIPENYFNDGSWNLNDPEAPRQIVTLLGHIIELPEFQLK